MHRAMLVLALGVIAAAGRLAAEPVNPPQAGPTSIVSLDGDEWLLAVDPGNVGRQESWFQAPRPEAKKTRVPWIIQDAFPAYHGVAWYWRDFSAPANPRPGGRYLLRFWAVDYKAEVWLNGTLVGSHEGSETPFTLDVTQAIKPGTVNRLAVRVVNPTHTPIDGLVLNEIPHRNKVIPYGSGSAFDQGGIWDSVELLVAPAVRAEEIFARPDWKTGVVRIQATYHNATAKPVRGQLEFLIAPAASGEPVAIGRLDRELPPGQTTVETQLTVPNPRLWELSDPFLYRVTARVATDKEPAALDETSVRTGFREFRFEKGAFRLNGRRIFLRCSHTGNCCPVGLEMPYDPDWLRRDLLNAKAMRFNAIRFISGVAKRYQLDLCDEIGLMVYEEAYASWCLADSPRMAERFDESILGMVRRDRNHPCLTIWGLLNETPDGAVFRHAAGLLPELRKLDDSRMVMINSGRWDSAGQGLAGLEAWRNLQRTDPCVTRNGTNHVIQGLGITWQPGQLSFHPGRDGEYSAFRWTAPADDTLDLSAVFTSIAEKATTDVHLLHNDRPIFDGYINLQGSGPEVKHQGPVTVKAGDTIDCVVGYGNGNYGADSTAVALTLKTSAGKVYNAAADFSTKQNPNGPWGYGQLAPGAKPKPSTFTLYKHGIVETSLGTLSNPGSAVWEDVLSDVHPYQRVPHTAEIINRLRTMHPASQPVFISEYGIGSAMDLLRTVRHYERLGKTEVEDAQLYRQWRDQFLADYQRWRLDEAFDRPEDFFAQSIARMAGQRLLGLNAIRANPYCVGHSITGTLDQGMTAEGLWTTFRELKPGTIDAVFDGWAPLRWSLFAEPVHVYRRTPIKLEAVLANEDALPPGEYLVRLQVVGPKLTRVFEKSLTLTIPERDDNSELPLAQAVFAEDVSIDGPPGKYRFLATFEKGAAAAGGEIEFYVSDQAEMPPVENEVVLWGEDPGLSKWLADHGIRTRPFAATAPGKREVILVSAAAPAPGDAGVWTDLARRLARGSTAVFLDPRVFHRHDRPTAWLPAANKGNVAGLPAWLYHKDDWCKLHPIFDGLPSPGLMDYTYYRDLIPDQAFVGQDPPAEAVAGGINASQGYSSGLTLAVYDLGAGHFILNTLRIRETLGTHPAADRLLRNLLRYASRDAAKPLAPMSSEWEESIKRLGY